MYYRSLLSIVLLLTAIPVMSQVNGTSAGDGANSSGASASSPEVTSPNVSNADVTNQPDDARMLVPPPTSSQAYPVAPESEARSNYLRAGVTFNSAYSDNVLGGLSAKPVSDVDYSVWPTIALDQTTARWHSILTYAPGFTFYQKTNGRDETDQNASMDLQYRVSQHVTASFRDSFQKSSNVFNQPDVIGAGAVYGSSQTPTAVVVPPVADRLSNSGTGELTYQFSASGMVGGSGSFTNLHYSNPSEVPGLYDSSSRGGSAFYSHRLSKKHYVGALYQYSRILAFPAGPQFETQSHTVFLFYTIYFKPNLSLSFSGGPQHYDAYQSGLFNSQSWSPAATSSLGWQGRHTTFAASYSRTVTGGGGLVGSFESNNANASARWQMKRTWNVGAAATYGIYKNVLPLSVAANPGGHAISGTVSVQHPMGEHFAAELGYTRLHQSFSAVQVVSINPDVNREFISVSYQFNRPLGR